MASTWWYVEAEESKVLQGRTCGEHGLGLFAADTVCDCEPFCLVVEAKCSILIFQPAVLVRVRVHVH